MRSNYVTMIQVRPGGKVDPWAVEAHYINGHSRVIGEFRFKFNAVRIARKVCQRIAQQDRTTKRSLELQIKGRDGRIKRKDSYRYDPERTRG